MRWVVPWNVALWILPGFEALDTSFTLTVHRQGMGFDVDLASDGACGSSAPAFAAVLADSTGVLVEALA